MAMPVRRFTGWRGWQEALWRDNRKRKYARQKRRAERAVTKDREFLSVAPADTGNTSLGTTNLCPSLVVCECRAVPAGSLPAVPASVLPTNVPT
jgi:hypothetical protein